MTKDISTIQESLFESIKHINEYGAEYWTARELMTALGYKQWRQFSDAVTRAKEACEASGNQASLYFADARKIVKTGIGTKEIEDYQLSRYACYLIAMNGDPRKEAIALAQTYFAIKTREQELAEQYDQLTEEQKRLAIRGELKHHNKSLADAAHEAGIETPREYAVFQNYGYMGLYGGLKAQDIARRKGLKKGEHILDHMGSTELAANLFRATQTDEKLRRENIKGRDKANRTHMEVGKTVRATIKKLGGTMPEDLPTPEKSIQKIKNRAKKATEREKNRNNSLGIDKPPLEV